MLEYEMRRDGNASSGGEGGGARGTSLSGRTIMYGSQVCTARSARVSASHCTWMTGMPWSRAASSLALGCMLSTAAITACVSAVSAPLYCIPTARATCLITERMTPEKPVVVVVVVVVASMGLYAT